MSISLLNRMLDAAEALDIDRALELFAEDAVFEFPFAPPGFPARLEGKATISDFFRRFPKYYRSIRFLDRRITALEDGSGVVGESRGEWVNLKGRPYNNTYIILLRNKGDRIAHVREFFNPLVWLESLES